MTTAIALTPAVPSFVAAVRQALSDLTPDEVDELTDGLEGDLAERANDPDAPELGDPVLYAEELRTAAGVPARAPTSALAQAGAALHRLRMDFSGTLRRNPSAAAVLDFFVSIRPVWWVYRGWCAYLWVVLGLGRIGGGGVHGLPGTPVAVIAFVLCMVVSVQFGRGRWLPWRWMRGVLVAINVVLVIASPLIALWLFNSAYYGYY